MEITTEQIKNLREESGAGIMDCRNALKETNGDKAKALEILQKQGLVKAQKTAGRVSQTRVWLLLIFMPGDASAPWWKSIARPISWPAQLSSRI